MKNAIEIVREMIKELEDKCEEYSLESNYTETRDKIDVLDKVIKRLREEK
jgi:hypothetical protein